jgi:hypothetical protein
MHITGGVLFMWDTVPSFQNVGSCLKKPDFGTPKIENALFMGPNGKQPL